MRQPIIIQQKRSRYILLIFLGLLMTGSNLLISIIMSVIEKGPLGWLLYFIMWFGLISFGARVIFFIMCLFSKILPPVIQVDERGVTDNSHAFSIGFIPWEDITCIYLRPYLMQTYVSATLKDNDKYLAKMNWLQKYTCKANLKMGFPLVNIIFTTTNQTAQQVYWQIVQQYGDKFMEQEPTNTAR